MTGYLPLIRKDAISHLHGVAVFVKEGLPLARDLSLENFTDSYIFEWLYFTHFLTSFSSLVHLLHLDVQFLILFGVI